MALAGHEVLISTGRRAKDAQLRVYVFADQLLALSVEGHGERAPALLLTVEQARRLQSALDELIPLAEEQGKILATGPEAWQGVDRRTTGQLK